MQEDAPTMLHQFTWNMVRHSSRLDMVDGHGETCKRMRPPCSIAPPLAAAAQREAPGLSANTLGTHAAPASGHTWPATTWSYMTRSHMACKHMFINGLQAHGHTWPASTHVLVP
eukprot:1156062-Pelagomonas_calceolata.AAC.4